MSTSTAARWRRRLRSAIRDRVRSRLDTVPPGRTQRLRRARRSLERHAAGRPLRLLDAGCETGLLALDLAARHPDWEVLGVDIAPEPLAAARAEAARRGLPRVVFATADLTRPWQGGTHDAVAALECLVEVPDHRAALRALAAATRPGGLLVVQVPTDTWGPLFPFGERRWRREARHGYARDELLALLDEAGFAVQRCEPTMRGVARGAQELRDLVKSRGVAAQLALLPLTRAAVWLDDRGLTAGAPRSWYVEALRR